MDFSEKLEMLEIFLHTDNTSASTGKQFETDATCTGKEVECRGTGLEINVDIVQDVEEAFLGKISRGTCLEGRWHVESFMLVFSSDDAHVVRIRR